MNPEAGSTPEEELTDEQNARVDRLMERRNMNAKDARAEVLYEDARSKLSQATLDVVSRNTGPQQIVLIKELAEGSTPFYQAEFPIDDQISEKARRQEAILELLQLREKFVKLEVQHGIAPEPEARRRAIERSEDGSTEELLEAIYLMEQPNRRTA